jgi:hypothetical protein
MKNCIIAFMSAVIVVLICIAVSNSRVAKANYERYRNVSHYKDSIIIEQANEVGRLTAQFIDLYNGGILLSNGTRYMLVETHE